MSHPLRKQVHTIGMPAMTSLNMAAMALSPGMALTAPGIRLVFPPII